MNLDNLLHRIIGHLDIESNSDIIFLGHPALQYWLGRPGDFSHLRGEPPPARLPPGRLTEHPSPFLPGGVADTSQVNCYIPI